METIELYLEDSLFMQLALMAHEQDITFNQLINNILREYLEILETEEKTHNEQGTEVQDPKEA